MPESQSYIPFPGTASRRSTSQGGEDMSRTLMLKVILAAAVLVPALIGPQAQAQQTTSVNASGACQSALPVYHGNFRNRPTGMRNQGPGNAFVSCSLSMAEAWGGESQASAGMSITNLNETAVDVTCTLINGRAPTPQYQTSTETIPAGGHGSIGFSLLAGGNPPGGDLPNFSCNLPPGTEINTAFWSGPASP